MTLLRKDAGRQAPGEKLMAEPVSMAEAARAASGAQGPLGGQSRGRPLPAAAAGLAVPGSVRCPILRPVRVMTCVNAPAGPADRLPLEGRADGLCFLAGMRYGQRARQSGTMPLIIGCRGAVSGL